MKKFLLTSVFASVLAVTAHAEENAKDDEQETTQEEITNKLGYFRMGIGARDVEDLPGPSLGFGKRYESAGNAIDVSVNFAFSPADSKRSGYFYSIPKLMYLKYFMPQSSSSIYAGAGLSFGGIKDKKSDDERIFHGLFGNLALGLEFNRKSIFRNFIQFDLNQPLIPLHKRGKTPKPTFELSFGVAY